MQLFEVNEIVDVAPLCAWEVWTDVNRWSQWDPHEEDATLDGLFEAGAKGWAKPKGAPAGKFALLDVVAGERWVSSSPLPGGGLTFTHLVEPAGTGSRLTLRSEVRGPLSYLLKWVWSKRMAADAPQTLRALGAEGIRRAAGKPR